jgi:hypothetical protein
LNPSQNHVPSLLSAILFILGGLFLFGIALFMGLTALASPFTGTEVQPQQTIFLAAFAFVAVVLFAAAFFALQKYLQKPAADHQVSLSLSMPRLTLLGAIAGVSILIGYLVSEMRIVNWVLLPILTIPAVALPLAVLLALGIQRLPLASRWQTWTVFGLSMSLGPILLFAFEILLAIVIFVGVVTYMVTRPELVVELQQVAEQMLVLGPQSEEAIELLAPFITSPGVMAVVLIYIALLVPAVEEIFKPIGVWLFARKLDSASQGFALGALSGAGYALIETIGVSGQQAADWAEILFSRIGTGLLHITTSALVGAAIVLALRERRYMRLLGTYLFAVLLHGLWNALAMFFTFSTIADMTGQAGQLSALQPFMIAAMASLAVVLFGILILHNRKWRKTVLPPPAPSSVVDERRDAGEIV